MPEPHSGLVATRADPRTMSLSAYVRLARARAEDILRKHGRDEGRTDSTCELCLVSYPCDAVRAAEDMIAINAKLHPSRPLSGEALLELFDWVEQDGGSARAAARPSD